MGAGSFRFPLQFIHFVQAAQDPYGRKGGTDAGGANSSRFAHSKLHGGEYLKHDIWPTECEFLIIGGGIVGSSIAFWLKQRYRDEDYRVVVVENEDTVR